MAAPTAAEPAVAPGVAPVAEAAPPGPPPAPTDPTAIALISTLETVCVPAVSGGNMDKLTKTAGYRKSGENYVMRGKGFQLTVLAPGSNPGTCHVDIISPVDPEAPAKPLVVALHNWAAVSRGYTLYRNDKNVTGAQELTTRSWELADGGKNQAVVLTTFRKADGTPSRWPRDIADAVQHHRHPGELTRFNVSISATDVAGVVGVLMMLGAYAAAQLDRLDPVKAPSLLLNLGGLLPGDPVPAEDLQPVGLPHGGGMGGDRPVRAGPGGAQAASRALSSSIQARQVSATLLPSGLAQGASGPFPGHSHRSFRPMPAARGVHGGRRDGSSPAPPAMASTGARAEARVTNGGGEGVQPPVQRLPQRTAAFRRHAGEGCPAVGAGQDGRTGNVAPPDSRGQRPLPSKGRGRTGSPPRWPRS